MVAISAEKTNAIQAIFSRSKAVIGVIHCDPFPGSPKYRGKSVSDIVERALRDAENYISGGVHGLIIENHGDIPFSKPEDIGHETSALMAVITEKVRERFGVPLGINVLANAAIPAMAIAIFALGVSKAPGIQQQRWLIGVLNALVDIQIAWFEQVLSARQIDPADYPDDLPGVRRFRDGMLRTAHEGSYEQIVTLMFGAEWMYYFWCRRASEHYQSDADLRRWVEMHAEDEFYQQALWLKNELDRCAMALSEDEKQALSALYGEVLQWEIDFHHAAYEE